MDQESSKSVDKESIKWTLYQLVRMDAESLDIKGVTKRWNRNILNEKHKDYMEDTDVIGRHIL